MCIFIFNNTIGNDFWKKINKFLITNRIYGLGINTIRNVYDEFFIVYVANKFNEIIKFHRKTFTYFTN